MKFISMIAALAIASLFGSAVLACSCYGEDTFLEQLKSAKKSEITEGYRTVKLLVGKVVSHKANSMQIEVVNPLQSGETRKTVTVWGDNGMLCRPYVSSFPVNTSWVLTLDLIGDDDRGSLSGRPSEELPGDYVISVCGVNWLKYVDNGSQQFVEGAADRPDPKQRMEFTHFTQKASAVIAEGKAQAKLALEPIKDLNLHCTLNSSPYTMSEWEFEPVAKSVQPSFNQNIVLKSENLGFTDKNWAANKRLSPVARAANDMRFEVSATIQTRLDPKYNQYLRLQITLVDSELGTTSINYNDLVVVESPSPSSSPLQASATLRNQILVEGVELSVESRLDCKQKF